MCPTLAVYATGGASLVVSWLIMYSMIKSMYETVGQSELHIYSYLLCMYMVTVLLESIIIAPHSSKITLSIKSLGQFYEIYSYNSRRESSGKYSRRLRCAIFVTRFLPGAVYYVSYKLKWQLPPNTATIDV